jgi:hypothetical protein
MIIETAFRTYIGERQPEAGTITGSWNGSRWLVITTPAPYGASLNSYSCANCSRCVAVGDEDLRQVQLVAGLRNGRSWFVDNPPHPEGIPANAGQVVLRQALQLHHGRQLSELGQAE